MTEYFRITGRNPIPFDALATGAADERYHLKTPQTGMDEPMTDAEVRAVLPRLPQKIRGHALQHGLSKITFPFSIKGSSDPDMEDARHDLTETLEDGRLYIETKGARGTRAVLQSKSNNAVAQSYKTIVYGEAMELGGRAVLGAPIKEHWLLNMQMTLYCEPYWRPAAATNLTDLVIVYNHDDADANHDNFLDIAAANLPGDVPGLTRVRITDENDLHSKFFLFARRTVGTPANFDHWLEAEAAGIPVFWGAVADPLRSAGNIVSDGANAAGSITTTILANLDHFKGRQRLYAALWTDDIVNTRFRLSWRWTWGFYAYNNWKRLGKVSTWQLCYLGTIDFDPMLYPSGGTIDRAEIVVEYQKHAADTCKCDYLMLLPEDESIMELAGASLLFPSPGDDSIEANGIADFPNSYMVVNATNDFFDFASRKAGFLTLQPGVNNRVYFKALSVAVGIDPFSQHMDVINNNDAPAASFHVTLDYLPQHTSPLE